MSKYRPLWEYVARIEAFPLQLCFDEIACILGFSIDHAFLTNKKEAEQYGFFVKKISLKERTVLFDRSID